MEYIQRKEIPLKRLTVDRDLNTFYSFICISRSLSCLYFSGFLAMSSRVSAALAMFVLVSSKALFIALVRLTESFLVSDF